MKHITKFLLAAVAASITFAPVADAQVRRDNRAPAQHQLQRQPAANRPVVRRPIVRTPVVRTPTRQWQRGQHYTNWNRHAPVRDYYRYGLRRPAPGHQWVKVGNQYLLINLITGIIASVAIGR